MNRRAMFVGIGAAAALLLIWYFLLWSPQGGKLKTAHGRTAAAESANTALQIQLSRLSAAQKQVPELMAQRDALRAAVPDDPELAQFILDANQAATDAGVDFISISPAVPQQSDPAQPPVIKLTINVSGPYSSVLDYLDRLDHLKRIVVVDNLTLSPSESQTGQVLNVGLSARMFATSAPQVTPPTTAAPAPSGDGSTTTTSTTSKP